MPKAKKLPSGSWRVQVFSHYEEIKQPDGTIRKKRIYRSFTCDDPSPKGRKKVELEAARFAAGQRDANSGLTVNEAIDRYIRSKESVLSPSTISGYKSLQRTSYSAIGGCRIDRLTQEQVQLWISNISAGRSPKTVRNTYTLLSSAIAMFDRNVRLDPELPQRKKPELYTPDSSEVKKLLDHVKGKDLEICICLAAFGPMRRGEICALTTDDIHGDTITVNKSMVHCPDGSWAIKQPKSYAGYRDITFPHKVIAMMEGRSGRIFDFTPDILSGRFKRAVRFSHLPHFRFHDLRHFSASILHAMGIPDEYITHRGGWSTDYVMKNIYRHSLSDVEADVNRRTIDLFNGLLGEGEGQNK